MLTMTVYCIIHSSRGEDDSAGIISVHSTRAGAVAAIHAQVDDSRAPRSVEDTYLAYDMDPAKGDLCTEDEHWQIQECEVRP